MAGKNGDGWLTVAEISAEFGVQETLFRRDYAPKLPAEGVREIKRGRTTARLFYWLPVLRMWREKAAKREERKADDEAGDSPNLELKRFWDAKRSEQAFRRDARELIPRADVQAIFDAVTEPLKRGIETLQKSGNRDGFDVIDEALSDAERVFRDRFASIAERGASDGEPHSPEADAPDAPIRGV